MTRNAPFTSLCRRVFARGAPHRDSPACASRRVAPPTMTKLDIERLTRIVSSSIERHRDEPPGSPGVELPFDDLERLADCTRPVRPAGPRRFGMLVGGAKRIFRAVLQRPIDHVLARQRLFNEAVVRVLTETGRQWEALDRQVAEQERVIVDLRQEVLRRVQEIGERIEPDPEIERALEGLRESVRSSESPQRVSAVPPPATVEDRRRYARFHDETSAFDVARDVYRRYVPRFRECRRVVDLACGRGPFLELLDEAEVSSYGVDSNPDFVRRVRERGLEAIEADALEHLESLEPAAIDGAFAGHFVEHLDSNRLLRFFRLVARALAEDGVFVFESPNTADLGVLARSYFRDPTHHLPRHPETYRFLVEACGFVAVRIEHSLPRASTEVLQTPPPSAHLEESVRRVLEDNVRRLNACLFGPANFAVVCRKSGRRP